MSWVIATFILLSTITMPVYGKLSDQFGRKPFLIFAILSFMTGSIIGALAPDMTWLIVARALQGVGGGGLMILSQSVVADVIPARERGKYMGIIGGVFAFSSVAGPLIGGWITEGPGWRWAFWLNLPLAILSIFAVIFLLPHTAFKDRESGRSTTWAALFSWLEPARSCLPPSGVATSTPGTPRRLLGFSSHPSSRP